MKKNTKIVLGIAAVASAAAVVYLVMKKNQAGAPQSQPGYLPSPQQANYIPSDPGLQPVYYNPNDDGPPQVTPTQPVYQDPGGLADIPAAAGGALGGALGASNGANAGADIANGGDGTGGDSSVWDDIASFFGDDGDMSGYPGMGAPGFYPG